MNVESGVVRGRTPVVRLVAVLLLVAACSPGLRGAARQQMADPDRPDQRLERLEHLMGDSPDGLMRFESLAWRDENGQIPANGLLNAQRQMRQMLSRQRADLSIAGISPGSWTSRGPGNIGGRIRAIAPSPVDANVVFLGGVDGGIWKTTDAGASWAPVNDFLANLAVSCLIFSSADPNTMYAGTGEGFYKMTPPVEARDGGGTGKGTGGEDFLRGAGIFKSTDAGAHWVQLAATITSDFYWVNRLTMSADGATLLAGTRTGMFRSTDAGASFAKVFTPPADYQDILDVKFLPGSSTRAVAAGYTRNAYYTNNGGVSWQAAGNPSPGGFVRGELGVSLSSPDTVYMLTDESQGLFWRSNDGGASYSAVSAPSVFTNQGWYDDAVWVDPTNASIVVIGGFYVWRSVDGGSSWSQIGDGYAIHPDHHIIISSPFFNGSTNRTVYFGGDGGIYRVQDAYGNPPGFEKLNHGLGITQFYSATGHAGTGRILGGTQDNGTLLSIPANGPNGWTPEFAGDGGASVIDPTDPNYLYGEYIKLTLHRSTNGSTGTDFIFGITSDYSGCKPAPYCLTDALAHANFIAPFVLDPNDPNRLLAGGWSLWRTDHVRAPLTATTGPEWIPIKPPTPDGSPISALAVAPSDSNIVWVGHNNGDVYMTTNGLAASPTWTRVDDHAGPIPNRVINSIALDPANPNVVYAATGGFTPDNLWKSVNGGASWTDATGSGGGGLPDAPIRAVTVHPTTSAFVYVGTEVGVFASGNGGASWGVPADTPSNVAVFGLSWMGTTLIAATHGRGIYTTTTSGAATSVTASPSTLAYGATKNGASGDLVNVTPPQSVTVQFSSGAYAWTASVDASWVQIAGGAGTGAGAFTVSIANPGNVIGGATSLSANITVSAPGAPIAAGGYGATAVLPVTLTVRQTPSGSGDAYGQVDAPAQNASGQQGAISISGWALDDLGVGSVKVYRNCLPFDPAGACQTVAGQTVVYVADAMFLSGARPDVETSFPGVPLNYRAGWGVQVLSNMMPDIPASQPHGGQGTFNLFAVATDLEGHTTVLGRASGDHTPTTVTLDNAHIAKPFGTADTPAPGSTVSGTTTSFLWALTPDSNTVADGTDILIPTNGSSMVLFVDGVAIGPAAYNNCRGNVGNPVPPGVYCNDDVSNIFGNATPKPPLATRTSNPTRFRNLDAGRGAIGFGTVDTTTLANGVHTLAWSVTDSAGRAEGIGSRFFSVLNGESAAVPSSPAPVGGSATVRPASGAEAPPAVRGAESDLSQLALSSAPLAVRTGFDPEARWRSIAASRGVHRVRVAVSGRLEVRVGSRADAGYLVVGDQLRDLPAGSSLDRRTGRFTWAPGPGQFGAFRLVFVDGKSVTVLDVTIAAR